MDDLPADAVPADAVPAGDLPAGDLPAEAPGVRERLGAALRSVETAAAVAAVDDRVSRWRRERKIGKGTLRATRVEAFRGWLADGTAHVRLRVTEAPPVPDAADGLPYVDVVKANLRRFAALPLSGVRLTVTMGDAVELVVTDRRGYAAARLEVGDLAPGWHAYRCVTQPDDPDEPPVRVAGEVLVPDPAADVAIISDIDDTVLRTGLTEGLVAAQRTLFRDASTRRPVPGMAVLYQGLRYGTGDAPLRPFWYLSTGPWALYDMLTDFLSRNGFPDGPLLLTDWGLNERYLIRSGREHKRTMLRRLFEADDGADSDRRFVLIGDSGQGDAEVYVEAARDHPGRCAAIIVIDVGEHRAERAADLAGWTAELAEHGIAFHLVPDAAGAAAVLAEAGLIAGDVVAAARADVARTR